MVYRRDNDETLPFEQSTLSLGTYWRASRLPIFYIKIHIVSERSKKKCLLWTVLPLRERFAPDRADTIRTPWHLFFDADYQNVLQTYSSACHYDGRMMDFCQTFLFTFKFDLRLGLTIKIDLRLVGSTGRQRQKWQQRQQQEER